MNRYIFNFFSDYATHKTQMFDIMFRDGWTVDELAALDENNSRNSFSSSPSSASGFSVSIPSDDKAGDSELESVSDYRLHESEWDQYCDRMREAQRSVAVYPSSDNEERNENSFFTARPRLGLADSLERFQQRSNAGTLRKKRELSPISRSAKTTVRIVLPDVCRCASRSREGAVAFTKCF